MLMLSPEVHIGNGVYASIGDGGVWLRAAQDDGSHAIWFDEVAFNALQAVVEDLKKGRLVDDAVAEFR